MFGRLGGRACQFLRPAFGGLARARIDQVERVSIENGTGDRNCIERLLRGMEPAKFFQRRIVEGLHAERNAVDAGGMETSESRGFHASRVGLRGYFALWRA